MSACQTVCMPDSPLVVVIGSANVDLVVDVARLPLVGETLLGEAGGRFAGGKGLNQALSSARIGARTRFCAAVGADESGDFLQNLATEAGVESDLLRVDRPTGVAHIFSLPDGDNSIVVAAGANGALEPSDVESAVAGASVVLAQLEIPVEAVRAGLVAGKQAGAFTILNAAPAHEATLSLLEHVDLLIVNDTECDELGGLETLLAAGVDVLVTHGGEGATLHTKDGATTNVAAFAIDPVDTTGAGDAFCGAFAAVYANTGDVAHALDAASAAGAIVALTKGASTPTLTAEAVRELVATR